MKESIPGGEKYPHIKKKVRELKLHTDSSLESSTDILSQVSHTHDVIMTLDITISSLETQLASTRSAKRPAINARQKFFFVMGIMTAFSSRKRRESIRETWMPQGY
ncbi:hypothetical protein L2E82_20650 [Cichorium intybus]|uniref:Uncharacterized protein n=1 Tax=Cichorium intybus TaxID=13427 RepID=A0ACB9DUX1_CICIN|nr:hypothetical protein L2E82_20650 [Cichorium intybus]